MMTNHVHLIIEPSKGGGDLSEIMKGINLSYARHYKRKIIIRGISGRTDTRAL